MRVELTPQQNPGHLDALDEFEFSIFFLVLSDPHLRAVSFKRSCLNEFHLSFASLACRFSTSGYYRVNGTSHVTGGRAAADWQTFWQCLHFTVAGRSDAGRTDGGNLLCDGCLPLLNAPEATYFD